ncbi:MAG: polysaccharide ABC transporter ATP-binding protein [Candidatus Moraniibacteriota bacterium]|jgi:ABC-2 type transport system ATP-binding protein
MNKKNNQQSNKKDKSIKVKKDASLRQGELNSVQERDHLGGEGTTKQSQPDKEIAVKVKNVSKIFKIPHKKIDSMKSAFVNSLKKNTYEEFYALKDISVEVKKGEFLGIIGHNGAGKSTLLKILAGVYQPTSGSIEVNGMISPFLELGIGFNPELSGRDNIYLNATVLGLTKKQIDEKFDEIVAFAELEKFIDEQLKNYSSGMKARLAFSVSIHADREILIMDEVLAVGDSRFQEKCLDIFRGYKERGKTVILVTHSMATVREYCDRALLLHKGELLGSGDVNDVCDEYIIKNMSEDQREELEKKERIEKEEQEHEKSLRGGMKRQVKNENIITDIQVFDIDRNKLTEITWGDDFFVEIEVQVSKIKHNLVQAVQIFDNETNVFLCGNNTDVDNFNCSWQKDRNVFIIYFKNTMFNTGEIYIKAVLFENKSGQNDIVDSNSTKELNNHIIKIKKQKGSGVGIMRIEHEWSKK